MKEHYSIHYIIHYQWNFLKVVDLKCFTERSNEQFLSQKALHIAYYQQKVSKNAMLK